MLVKGEKFGVRFENMKYIEGVEDNVKELFDLFSDPLEKRNLYASDPKKAEELASMIVECKAKCSRPGSSQTPGRISRDDIDALKSLGYVE